MKKLNGFEFTKINYLIRNIDAQRIAKDYPSSNIVYDIVRINPDIRKDEDYIDATDWFMETTMSCNAEETIAWMGFYMANAIAYGMETKNLDWKAKYVAAYDILRILKI